MDGSFKYPSHQRTQKRKETKHTRRDTPPTQIGRCRRKPSRSPNSPGERNLNLHVDRMKEQQLEQAIETIKEDPTTVTLIDKNGNENQIKTEITEIPNPNETNNKNNQFRRSSRIRPRNPIVIGWETH